MLLKDDVLHVNYGVVAEVLDRHQGRSLKIELTAGYLFDSEDYVHGHVWVPGRTTDSHWFEYLEEI